MTVVTFLIDMSAVSAGPRGAPGVRMPDADQLLKILAGVHFLLLLVGLAALSGFSFIGFWGGLGVILSFGLYFGSVSAAVAHELIHREDPRLARLGKWIYISLLYGHHVTSHLHVHHRFVATPEDPATARMHENFYSYVLRAWPEIFVSGYEIEKSVAALKGESAESIRHPYALYIGGSTLIVLVVTTVLGFSALIGLLIFAFAAQTQIMLQDYVQHYGLRRALIDEDTYEDVAPWHSWNSTSWFSAGLMLNTPRHSLHHTNPELPFHELSVPAALEAPRLPQPLPFMCLAALFPPAFNSMMDRPAKGWRERTEARSINHGPIPELLPARPGKLLSLRRFRFGKGSDEIISVEDDRSDQAPAWEASQGSAAAGAARAGGTVDVVEGDVQDDTPHDEGSALPRRVAKAGSGTARPQAPGEGGSGGGDVLSRLQALGKPRTGDNAEPVAPRRPVPTSRTSDLWGSPEAGPAAGAPDFDESAGDEAFEGPVADERYAEPDTIPADFMPVEEERTEARAPDDPMAHLVRSAALYQGGGDDDESYAAAAPYEEDTGHGEDLAEDDSQDDEGISAALRGIMGGDDTDTAAEPDRARPARPGRPAPEQSFLSMDDDEPAEDEPDEGDDPLASLRGIMDGEEEATPAGKKSGRKAAAGAAQVETPDDTDGAIASMVSGKKRGGWFGRGKKGAEDAATQTDEASALPSDDGDDPDLSAMVGGGAGDFSPHRRPMGFRQTIRAGVTAARAAAAVLRFSPSRPSGDSGYAETTRHDEQNQFVPVGQPYVPRYEEEPQPRKRWWRRK